MQKPAFFAIVGISLLVTAVCLGYSVSRYLSARYFAPPPPPRRAAQAAKGKLGRDIPPERWTNVFAPAAGMDIPSRLVKQSGGPGGGPAAGSSSTAYVLVGTIASDTPSARRAILWAQGMKEPAVVREHAEVEPGVRVAEIGREYVWLQRGAARERLELLPVGANSKTTSAPARRAAPVVARRIPTSQRSSLHVDKIGENTFALDEASVTQLTSNINQFMTQVRIIPYFESNKSAGYRLAAMRPGSAFDQLGFRGGDVIQRVNNLELSSPEKLYTIFQNLKDEKRVTVDILRHGQKNTLTYEIR